VPWLVKEDKVLATVEVADSFVSRLKGLLGRSDVEGAYLIRGAGSVHTLGMRFPIDVAYCDEELNVICTRTMRPMRVGRPRRRARVVIEARAGAFERWGLEPGDCLEIR
jgi:uncharacterized protein